MHVTFPKQVLTPEHFVNFPSNVTRIVSVLHHSHHYAVLDIDIHGRRVIIFDGLNRPVLHWLDHVVSSLKRAKLIGINETCTYAETEDITERIGIRPGSSKAYKLTFDESQQEWQLEKGHFVKQLDGYECGPIACTKMLEIFGLVTEFEVNLAYAVGNIRSMVTNHWKHFLERCNDDLIIRRKVERRPVAEIVDESAAQSEGGETSIANIPTFDPLDVCHCFDDESHMDILRLVCCKALVHRECVLSWLEFETSCPYCNSPVDDIAIIQKQPAIDRTKGLPSTPPMTPQERRTGSKRDLQAIELDYALGSPTPVRLADKMRTISQEKKRDSQLKQAQTMMDTRSKAISNKGVGIGAIVTVIPDYRAVSHPVGIVGIVYKFKESGGAQVATVAGLLVQSGKKDWWIPDDQYILRYKPDEEGPIDSRLREIRASIHNGTYNTTKRVKRCTIQDAHKVVTDQVSPQKMGKCGCMKGQCNPKRCGCATRKRKCTSSCTCNGNCTGNPNNGK